MLIDFLIHDEKNERMFSFGNFTVFLCHLFGEKEKRLIINVLTNFEICE